MIQSQTLTTEAATSAITSKVILLEGGRQLNPDTLAFYVEKLVGDILDYCHREDFPATLVYSVVDLVRKRLADEGDNADASNELGLNIRAPVSKVKMDDTEFTFAVGSVDAAGCLSDLDFSSLKPKLNLYRKVVSL